MKIAFDENVPPAMVRVFQTFASEKQLQKLVAASLKSKARKITHQQKTTLTMFRAAMYRG